MGNLLQKVYLIFVRPYYIANGYKTYYDGTIYAKTGPDYTSLTNNVQVGTAKANVDLNESGKYKNDPWFLHSSYTSYEKFRESIKSLMTEYGTNNIRATIYIPVDFEVLPNQ